MAAFRDELVDILLGTNIKESLAEDRLTLQQLSLLSYPGVLQALAKRLGLSTPENLDQFKYDYNWEYYTRSCSQYLSTEQCFVQAASYGDLETVKYYMKNDRASHREAFIAKVLRAAAKNNQFEIVNYILNIAPNFDAALYGASAGNCGELFNYLLEKNPNYTLNNLFTYLYTAASNNAILVVQSVVDRLLEIQPDNNRNINRNIRLAQGLLAVYAKDLETVKRVINENPDIAPRLILIAAKINATEIIDFLFSTGDNKHDMIVSIIEGAIKGGNFDLYDRYYSPDMEAYISWNLDQLTSENKRDWVKIMLDKNPRRMRALLSSTIKFNNRGLLQYLIDIEIPPDNVLDKLIEAASQRMITQDLVPFLEKLKRGSI